MRIQGAVLRTAGVGRPYADGPALEVTELELDAPGPGEVLVRIVAAGLCHSDLSVIDGSRIRPLPMLLGHEASGTIVGVGEGVDRSRIGQRVSIEPQRPDPDSEETRRGHYNLCPHMQFFGTPPVDGAFCDYVTIGAACRGRPGIAALFHPVVRGHDADPEVHDADADPVAVIAVLRDGKRGSVEVFSCMSRSPRS